MQCQAFNEIENKQCENRADYPYMGCDSECGWMYKKSLAQLHNVLSDNSDWKDIISGIRHWSVAKYLYYYQLK